VVGARLGGTVIRSKTRGVLVGRVSSKISLLRPSGRVLGVEALKEALAYPLPASRSVGIIVAIFALLRQRYGRPACSADPLAEGAVCCCRPRGAQRQRTPKFTSLSVSLTVVQLLKRSVTLAGSRSDCAESPCPTSAPVGSSILESPSDVSTTEVPWLATVLSRA